MNYSDYRFTLDITNTVQSQMAIPVMVGDTARKLYIGLVEDGKPYTIEDGCRAVFVGRKPNDAEIFNDCIIERNKTIIYQFTPATTGVEGIMNCEIRLYGIDGTLLTTPRFIIIVDKRVVRDVNIPDSEKTAIDNIMVIEQSRAFAESLRVAAEQERVAAEQFRVEAERVRVAADEKRNEDLKNLGDKVDELEERIDEFGNTEGLGGRVETLERQVADLMYEPVTITSFVNNVKTAKFGEKVQSVTFTWAFSREPVSVQLNDDTGLVDKYAPTSTGATIAVDVTNNAGWTLKATDERGTVASKSTSITFNHGVYYGVGDARDSYDSAFINSLSVEWRTNKKPSFTPSPNNQHVYYCLPVSMGKCSFSVGVLPGGFELVGTISHTNDYGGTENYYIYRSVEALSGTITVNVA